jgi:hypothetical protein
VSVAKGPALQVPEMSILKLTAIASILLCWAPLATGDDTGTVSIVGKNVDSSDSKTFGLMLTLATKAWQEFEPGGATHFFKTKRGIYVYVPGTKTIYLCNTSDLGACIQTKDSQAGQLLPIDPSSAKKGDHGTGEAEETGISFSWSVN